MTQNGDWPAFRTGGECRFFSCDGLVCINPVYERNHRDRWRTALIEGDAALTDYVGRYPHTDVRRLRTLLRDARLAPGPVQVRAFRELFAYLRQNEEAHRQE